MAMTLSAVGVASGSCRHSFPLAGVKTDRASTSEATLRTEEWSG